MRCGAKYSCSDQASGHRRSVSDERLDTKFISRDAELEQLGLVDADGIVVSLDGVGQRVLEVAQNRIFCLDRLLHVLADVVDGALVEA